MGCGEFFFEHERSMNTDNGLQYVGDQANNHIITVRHRETVTKDGFETTIRVPHYSWVEVKGLDATGQVLGSTGVWDYELDIEVDESKTKRETG
jgi:hypothetical protein